MQPKKCAICGSNAESGNPNGYIHFICIRCGDYFITRIVIEDYRRELEDQFIVTKISGGR